MISRLIEIILFGVTVSKQSPKPFSPFETCRLTGIEWIINRASISFFYSEGREGEMLIMDYSIMLCRNDKSFKIICKAF